MTESQINRKVQLAFAGKIIATFAEDTIGYRALVASVEIDQWMRHSREALYSGLLEVAPHRTNVEHQTHSGWWASPDGGSSGGDK
jgi:hypothetical protein